MANVEIYMKMTCPFSRRALALLEEKGASPHIYDISPDPGLREEMIERSGGRTTVPQVFINDRHIGGCDDLMDLDAQGGLDPMLAS